MVLSAGTRLGSYQILAPIGAGGMGEVYKARDTKLDREVAIKVLPAALARDPERLGRFEREAKILASLNHPNIAQIYAIEEVNGVRALAMELVPGQTLKCPLPFEEALRIAGQIADALEAAHDKGVVHRDLKPANIMITPAGSVKVLDFGLAAVTQPSAAPASGDPSQSPTLTMGATQAGMILGTAAYMSPEQASGQPVDKRADIWSFGVVLWEMLTGERLFTGDTIAHILAAVLQTPIDFEKLPPSTPRAIRDLLKRCLDRDVKTRLRDIGEARIAIQNPVPEPVTPSAPAPPPSRDRMERFLWPAIAALAIAITLIVSVVHFREAPPPADVIQFSIPSPERSSFVSWVEISPDGKYLAYSAPKDGPPTLWVRPLNSQQARPLITEASFANSTSTYPFWSSDSRWIAYASAGKLKKVDVTAASPAPLVICDCVSNFRGGAWNRDGVILMAPNAASGLVSVPAAGGSPVPVTTLDARLENLHRFPTFLPDGRHFLYFAGSPDRSHAGVYVQDLGAKSAAKRILDSDSHAVFVPRSPESSLGHLLFVKDDSLRAVPFDAQRLEVTGEPTVLATGVDQRNVRGSFSASTNGILAYWAGNTYAPPDLNWYGRDGKLQGPASGGAAVPQGILTGLSLSPDAQRLAAGLTTSAGGANRVSLFDLSRGGLTPLGSEKSNAVAPVWSADAKRLAFGYSEAGALNLFVRTADQPDTPERLLATTLPAWPTDWSQDGGLLVYEIDNGGQHDLWALSLPDKKPHVWLQGPASEAQGQLAPGAAKPWWMAYTSNESGRAEVYLESFTLDGRRAGRVQISTTGGGDPRWRGDGRELYYASADEKLMAVEIRPGFAPGSAKELFALPRLAQSSIYRPHRFSVTRDGKRFLIATTPANQPIAPLSVVVNWQEELRH
jgi:serine/threonine protein kinase